LTSKCDLDLGGRGAGVVLDISSYNCDYLCQVISNFLELCRSSRSDTNIPYNRLCLFLTSKCDLDGRDAGVARDTLSYYSDYLC
jgi:hypothetical protein